ncbi:putative M protein repeat protein [Rosellinia necatrix]|uniref:Putative M protein repeat protein n=1 Tax=Rosellinia necatrix TaxID=77044 RepID=A0A1W2TPK2_ROSNE|nr:putative M protein repeat protein [Rosellinia necatrix]
MSASQKSSRWGSFLSQAVAGVEARLDNILAEEDASKGSTASTGASSASPAPPTPPARSTTPAKSANDRLQERLARAVASRNAAASARQSLEVASTSSSPRPSSDIPQLPPVSITQAASPRTSLSVEETTTPASCTPMDASAVTPTPTADDQSLSIPSPRTSSQLESAQTETNTKPEIPTNDKAQPATDDAVASSLYKERVAHLEETLEEVQAQHQEELHSHIEQLDTLQTKLQYLAREASENARAAAANAPAGSSDKKIAEKNDQIAQLMLEGQKLASTEQKHRSIIKKLRAQLVTNEKELNEEKVWRQKAEKELADLRSRIDESNDLEKANEETYRLLSQSRREIDRLKVENEAKDRSITDLTGQLQEESERAKSLAVRAEDHQREAGQKRIKELEDTVAALEVEKGLAADRAKSQVAEARERAERVSGRARAVELELKGEVQVLESKLETLRAKAEEASSGAVGDAQVKLLRQIETLQTQYSVASENWQGMESSLEARIVNLEKERDEALRRESEMRKRGREAANRAKRLEEELDEMRSQLPSVERNLQSYQSQLDALKTKAKQAEAALADAKAELAKNQASLRNDKEERVDYDRRNWLDDVPAATFRDRGLPESPLLTAPQRTFSGDNFLGLQNYSNRFRKTSAPSSNGEPCSSDRPSQVRRPSVQPPTRSPLFPALSGLPAATTASVASGFDFVAPAPTQATDRDDVLEGLERSASPQNLLQDMVSVSTMTAGPSVQLVERMSAAIRRLESEKVAGKEELARISSQRDDARGEIVVLIRELETSKAAMQRAANLEVEVAKINERYQTTLEMLGEKSELVEELRADVQDVKAMYRDLVERTIK